MMQMRQPPSPADTIHARDRARLAELRQSIGDEIERLVAPVLAAAPPLPNDAVLAEAFRDMESSIRDLKIVATTVALLFDDVFDYQHAEKPPGYLRFIIPAVEHDCLLYAIEHARGLAGKLTTEYEAGYARWQGAAP